MSNTRTVLIITSHYPPNIGGVESHLQALVTALIKRNWRVIISTYQPLAYRKKAQSTEKRKGLVIYRQGWLGFNVVHKLTPYPVLEFLYLFPGLFIRTLIATKKHREDIDVIHCQGLVPTAIGVIVGKLFSKRVISSTHNLYFFPKKSLYADVAKLIFSSTDRVLVATELAKKELVGIGVAESKIDFFKYWINLNVFHPIKKSLAKKQLNWHGFKVLFVGRLIPTKGVNMILDIVKSLKNDVGFIIAGSGALEEKVKTAAKQQPEKLNFLGRIENVELSLYYGAADFLLAPSIVDEGWGFVAMEAIACGTPVIASNVGGLSDVISSEIGRLVATNTRSFKNVIEHLYAHPNELIRLQKNCSRYAQNNFGESNADLITKHYGSSDR